MEKPGPVTILVIALTAGILAFASRLQDRSWVGPAAIFALIWAAYMPTLLFFIDSEDVFVPGMLWILASVACVWAGSASAATLCPAPRERHVVPSPKAIFLLRHLLKVPIVAGLADMVWLFVQRGMSLSDLASFAAIMAVSAANRSEQYAGEADTPVGERIAFTLLFLGCLYGGMLFRLSNRRSDKALALGALLLIIAINTLHGSRFGSIYGGAFWLSGYLATYVAISNPKKGIGGAFLVRFATAGVVIVFALSMATMIVRYTIFADVDTKTVSFQYMFTDPFGFVAAFGIWFRDMHMHPDGPLWGARVFRRVLAFFGRQYELYDAIDVGFNSSNVFTIFRELIEDFSLLGSLVFLALYGFLGRVAFWKVGTERGHMALPWLAVTYIFAFTSVASSAFAYTTILAAAAMFAVGFAFLPPIAIPVSAAEPPLEPAKAPALPSNLVPGWE